MRASKTLGRIIVMTAKVGSYGAAARALRAGGFDTRAAGLDIFVKPDAEGLSRTAQLVRGQLVAYGMTVHD